MPMIQFSPDGGLNTVKLRIGDDVDPSAAVEQWTRDREEQRAGLINERDAALQASRDARHDSYSNAGHFAEGASQEIKDFGRNVANIALPDSITPEWASDQTILDNRADYDADHGDSGYGTAGRVAGGVLSAVATAPVGGAVGAGGRIALQGARAAQGLRGAGGTTAALNTAAKATAPTRAAMGKLLPKGRLKAAGATMLGEGAVHGAIAGGPDNRASGAGMGLATAGIMRGGANAVSRIGAKGIAKLSPDAKAFSKTLSGMGEDGFIPLAQGGSTTDAASSLLRTINRDFLSAVPFFHGRLKGLEEGTRAAARRAGLKMGLPEKMRGMVTGTDPQKTMRHMTDFWDNEAYTKFKLLPLNAGRAFVQKADDIFANRGHRTAVNAKFKDKVLARLNESPTGDTVLSLKRELNQLGGAAAAKGDPVLTKQYNRMRDYLDDLVEANFTAGSKNSQLNKVYQEYKALSGPYNKYLDLVDGVAAASKGSGNFSGGGLASASGTRTTNKRSAQGLGGMQNYGGKMGSTIDKGLQPTNAWRAMALGGLVTGMGMASKASLPFTLAPLGMSVSKGGQKALYGQTGIQQKLQNALRQNAGGLNMAGSSVRNMAAGQAGGTE